MQRWGCKRALLPAARGHFMFLLFFVLSTVITDHCSLHCSARTPTAKHNQQAQVLLLQEHKCTADQPPAVVNFYCYSIAALQPPVPLLQSQKRGPCCCCCPCHVLLQHAQLQAHNVPLFYRRKIEGWGLKQHSSCWHGVPRQLLCCDLLVLLPVVT